MSEDSHDHQRIDSGDVLSAFNLGWHMTELFYCSDIESAPRKIPTWRLANPDEMDWVFQARLLVAKVDADLRRVWADLVPDEQCPTMHDLIRHLQAGDLTERIVTQDVSKIHEKLLEKLAAARDFRQLKAYRLGTTLAYFANLPRGELMRLSEHPADLHPDRAPGPEDVSSIEQCVTWLVDLRSSFPPHSAEGVRVSLETLQAWLFHPQITARPSGQPQAVRWHEENHRRAVCWSFRKQSLRWHSVLIGESAMAEQVTNSQYLAASKGWLRTMRKVLVEYVRRFWISSGLIVFLLLAAGWVAVQIQDNQRMVAVLITIAGAFGFTWHAAASAVSHLASNVSVPIWERELDKAIASTMRWRHPDIETWAKSQPQCGGVLSFERHLADDLMMSVSGLPEPETVSLD